MARWRQREEVEPEDLFWIWSWVTSQVRRSPSKRSCETEIFTLPLLRLNRPPVETRTAGSLLDEELHCELLLSVEPDMLPVAEPAAEVPLEAPRLPDEPLVEPVPELDPVLP